MAGPTAREILVDRAERDRLRPFGRADQLGLQGLPRRRGQRPPGPDREDQRDRAHHGGRHRGAGDPTCCYGAARIASSVFAHGPRAGRTKPAAMTSFSSAPAA